MKERPILFSAPMVRAILEGRKTQTRRIVKPQPKLNFTAPVMAFYADGGVPACPYGQPGDRLWVRENGWQRPERTPKQMREGADTWKSYYYDADDISIDDIDFFRRNGFNRRPSIHMPRWASRITLDITGVRVERLHGINWMDAVAEGCNDPRTPEKYTGTNQPCGDPVAEYMRLWNSINGPGSWAANPLVWVVEFKPTYSAT